VQQPAQPLQPPPVQADARYRKVLSAEERQRTIARANGLVDWMADLLRRWEESSEGPCLGEQPPLPPPPPPLPRLDAPSGRLRRDQVDAVFQRADEVSRRAAAFESQLSRLEGPDSGLGLLGGNPAFETEVCEVDMTPPAPPRRQAPRAQSRDFDPRDPFDPLARDPFAYAVFDPFTPPEERRAS
jgi:hypothetical protein